MFVPGVQHGFQLPRHLPQFGLALVAVSITVIGWAIAGPIRISSEASFVVAGRLPLSIHSVAYAVAEDGYDNIYVRRADAALTGTERRVARFPVSFNQLRVRGAAAPTGTRLAVLSAGESSSNYARLSLIDLQSGVTTPVPGDFDYLALLAWSPDGERVAASRTLPGAESLTRSIDVVEVDALSVTGVVVAHWDNVFSVAPLGYSVDNQRFFVVVVDQSGSWLWTVRDGKAQKSVSLSPGRTRDWSLSPDGSRLAYVDVLGAGERGYAGRTLVIATGAIADSAARANELSPVWEPGSQVPMFGGPGGSARLAEVSAGDAYVLPAAWSPDGKTLVARIYSASSDRGGSPKESVELVLAGHRVPLSGAESARFLGWVVD